MPKHSLMFFFFFFFFLSFDASRRNNYSSAVIFFIVSWNVILHILVVCVMSCIVSGKDRRHILEQCDVLYSQWKNRLSIDSGPILGSVLLVRKA